MTRRILVGQLALAGLLAGLVAAQAQDTRAKPPDCRYGITLKYRKAGEDDFKATQKYAVECFQEESGNAIYVSQTGALSVLPKALFKVNDTKRQDPLAQHGLELTVRKADGKTAKFGVECFLDEMTGNLIFLSETGSLSVVPARYAAATKGKPKGAPLLYGMNLHVRKHDEKDFTKDTRRFGVDVFEDANNNVVLYLSETGSIAAVPRALVNKDGASGKKPDWQYGFSIKARSASEKEFGKDTKSYGVEVFKDENNGCMIYVTENGNLAVVPAKLAKFIEGKSKDPEPKRGMSLGVRKVDEKDFTDSTKKIGVDVYADENSGNLVYISEVGALAAAPPKAE